MSFRIPISIAVCIPSIMKLDLVKLMILKFGSRRIKIIVQPIRHKFSVIFLIIGQGFKIFKSFLFRIFQFHINKIFRFLDLIKLQLLHVIQKRPMTEYFAKNIVILKINSTENYARFKVGGPCRRRSDGIFRNIWSLAGFY